MAEFVKKYEHDIAKNMMEVIINKIDSMCGTTLHGDDRLRDVIQTLRQSFGVSEVTSREWIPILSTLLEKTVTAAHTSTLLSKTFHRKPLVYFYSVSFGQITVDTNNVYIQIVETLANGLFREWLIHPGTVTMEELYEDPSELEHLPVIPKTTIIS